MDWVCILATIGTWEMGRAIYKLASEKKFAKKVGSRTVVVTIKRGNKLSEERLLKEGYKPVGWKRILWL